MVALGNLEDRHHETAVAFYRGLAAPESLHLSNYVLDELLTRLGRLIGPGLAAKGVTHLLESPLYVIHWIGEDVHRGALQLFRETKRRGASFTDCTSFALMRRLGIRTAFTFDRDFAAAGFGVVPRA